MTTDLPQFSHSNETSLFTKTIIPINESTITLYTDSMLDLEYYKKSSSLTTFTIYNDDDTVSVLVVLENDDLAGGCKSGKIKIWGPNKSWTWDRKTENWLFDSDSWILKKTLEGHKSLVYSLVVLKDGYLASGSWDKTIKIWNTNDMTNKPVHTLNNHTDRVYQLAVLYNGSLVSSSRDGTLRIWDPYNGILLFTLYLKHKVVSLALLRNGLLAIGRKSSLENETYSRTITILPTITIFDTSNWKVVKEMKSADIGAYVLITVEFGLANAGRDNSIKAWLSEDNYSMPTSQLQDNVKTNSLVNFFAMFLAIGSEDGRITIWNYLTGEKLKSYKCHTGRVTSLAVLKDESLVSSSFSDATVKIHESPRLPSRKYINFDHHYH